MNFCRFLALKTEKRIFYLYLIVIIIYKFLYYCKLYIFKNFRLLIILFLLLFIIIYVIIIYIFFLSFMLLLSLFINTFILNILLHIISIGMACQFSCKLYLQMELLWLKMTKWDTSIIVRFIHVYFLNFPNIHNFRKFS